MGYGRGGQRLTRRRCGMRRGGNRSRTGSSARIRTADDGCNRRRGDHCADGHPTGSGHIWFFLVGVVCQPQLVGVSGYPEEVSGAAVTAARLAIVEGRRGIWSRVEDLNRMGANARRTAKAELQVGAPSPGSPWYRSLLAVVSLRCLPGVVMRRRPVRVNDAVMSDSLRSTSLVPDAAVCVLEQSWLSRSGKTSATPGKVAIAVVGARDTRTARWQPLRLLGHERTGPAAAVHLAHFVPHSHREVPVRQPRCGSPGSRCQRITVTEVTPLSTASTIAVESSDLVSALPSSARAKNGPMRISRPHAGICR
jgi:hypothetical protein